MMKRKSSYSDEAVRDVILRYSEGSSLERKGPLASEKALT